MPPKRRRRFKGLYYHSSPPKVLSMNGQIANSNGRRTRGPDDLSVKLATIRIWMHEKDIGKLTRVLWAGQGNRLSQQASTNSKVKRFLAAVPYVMNSIRDVHQAIIDNNLENLQSKLEPPVPPALVTCRDANGLNLIHKAAGLGHATILEYLISTWPDGVHDTDITGKTPLHWAASAKNNMRCYTLLTQAGCDEEAVDYKMKTPSFYRHKPNEIERAFLTYVPEAPRVSPDIATDWDALSDDSGDGKKPDIKIPEMNGFGRQSNAESNENASEAEMTDVGHEEDDTGTEKVEITTADENSAEDDAQNNKENDDEELHIKEEDEEQEEEDKIEEKEEETKSDSANANEEMQEEENEEEEPQDEKQQTQTVTETPTNLTKDDLEAKDIIENENMESEEKHVEAQEENAEDSNDHTTAEEGVNDVLVSETSNEIASDIYEEDQINDSNEKQTIEQENENIGKEHKTEEENKKCLDDMKNEMENMERTLILTEENDKEDEGLTNGTIESEEENRPTSGLQTDHDIEKDSPENSSKQAADNKYQEDLEGLPENETDTMDLANDDENDKEDDSKTLAETVANIKNEVKDNVKYLAKQIKNVFNDNEDEEEVNGLQDETLADDSSEQKENDENGNQENEVSENKTDLKDEENEDTDKRDYATEYTEIIKKNVSTTNASTKDIGNQEECQEESELQDGILKTANEENKKYSPEQTPASSRSSPDNGKEVSDNANKTVEPSIQIKADAPQTSLENSNRSNSPSIEQSQSNTAPKTPPIATLQEKNDKTDEDNNNNSKLSNETGTTSTDALNENLIASITDEQFNEINESLEEYKKAEENYSQDPENNIRIKLEEMADTVKENVKEMAGKMMNVFAKNSETESNDVVIHTDTNKKEKADKKFPKEGESSDDTADEDEVQFGTL